MACSGYASGRSCQYWYGVELGLAVRNAIRVKLKDAGSKRFSLRGGVLANDGFQPPLVPCPQPKRWCGSKGHDETSMSSFQFHLPIIGTPSSKAQRSRLNSQTRIGRYDGRGWHGLSRRRNLLERRSLRSSAAPSNNGFHKCPLVKTRKLSHRAGQT